jgi:glycosyltransferase involved in cell wall biosynthesis
MDIIKALNGLGNTNLKILLLVIGTGRMQEQLEAAVKKHTNIKVCFTGFVDPIELPGYYAATDIYIHPAKIDPHPLAISEAIYMGCPVIVSDRCGSYGENDDVQDGHNGFVYEWGNIDQLKHYIEQLSNDIELRKRFGEYSHNFAINSQQLSHSLGLMSALKNNGLISD